MLDESDLVCNLISEAVKKQFLEQRTNYRIFFPFQAGVRYYANVHFIFKPDSSCSNMTLGDTCAATKFYALVLYAVRNCQMPKSPFAEDTRICISCAALAQDLGDISVVTKIDVQRRRGSQSSH